MKGNDLWFLAQQVAAVRVFNPRYRPPPPPGVTPKEWAAAIAGAERLEARPARF